MGCRDPNPYFFLCMLFILNIPLKCLDKTTAFSFSIFSLYLNIIYMHGHIVFKRDYTISQNAGFMTEILKRIKKYLLLCKGIDFSNSNIQECLYTKEWVIPIFIIAYNILMKEGCHILCPAFCVQLISLSVMSYSFIHFVANIRILLCNTLSHCLYTYTISIYYILYIYYIL